LFLLLFNVGIVNKKLDKRSIPIVELN
jgi:hypothetical protein